MFYHYRPQLEHGKLFVVHHSGAKLEFEIMEKSASALMIKALSKERKEIVALQNQERYTYPGREWGVPFDVTPIKWSVTANIPSKEALLVLKASHIYFPINWRKNCTLTYIL